MNTNTNTNKYLIGRDGNPVAITTAAPGSCQYAWQRSREVLNASREFNLVNARAGRVSRAKKWALWAEQREGLPFGEEINPREIYIWEEK